MSRGQLVAGVRHNRLQIRRGKAIYETKGFLAYFAHPGKYLFDGGGGADFFDRRPVRAENLHLVRYDAAR